jgi:hypothetical protein
VVGVVSSSRAISRVLHPSPASSSGGRALTGHSHDYNRHGTTTLFAAFEVATGKVRAAHKKRRRRKEFLDFMDDVVAAYPNRRLEVILDISTPTRRATLGSPPPAREIPLHADAGVVAQPG